jgi:hypothetical protein
MNDLTVPINATRTRFVLLKPHTFDEENVTVPAGYCSEFASIPRVFWSFGFTPLGRHQRAALLHDWLYNSHRLLLRAQATDDFSTLPDGIWPMSRRDADLAFRRQMQRDGVGWRSRWVMYLAVRLFGRAGWYRMV